MKITFPYNRNTLLLVEHNEEIEPVIFEGVTKEKIEKSINIDQVRELGLNLIQYEDCCYLTGKIKPKSGNFHLLFNIQDYHIKLEIIFSISNNNIENDLKEVYWSAVLMIPFLIIDILRPLQKSPSPNSRNLNTGFRLFPFQITPDSTQIPP